MPSARSLAEAVFLNLRPSFGDVMQVCWHKTDGSSREGASCLSHLDSALRTDNLFSLQYQVPYHCPTKES